MHFSGSSFETGVPGTSLMELLTHSETLINVTVEWRRVETMLLKITVTMMRFPMSFSIPQKIKNTLKESQNIYFHRFVRKEYNSE